jgi:outer membrane protein assembly factor BamB
MGQFKNILGFTAITILLTGSTALRAADWPQWQGPTRDNVWHETGVLEKFPAAGPTIRWRVPVGAGYSSPSVAAGKVFVIDRVVKEGAPKPPNPFARLSTPGVERVLCLDEVTGKTLWSKDYPCDYTMSYNAGPRAAPLIEANRVYTFGGEGDLQCRATADGSLLWQTKFGSEHTPMWGFAASPLIEGDELIAVGADPQGTVVAFDKMNGKPLWKAVPAKEPGYSSPVVIDAGGTRQLIVWNPEALYSLDPKTGKVFWKEPITSNAGMSIATPRRSGDLLLVTSFYNGAMMMKLDPNRPAATQLWKIGGKNEKKTEALHAVMCTPYIADDFIYGVCSYGQLRGLRAATGQRVWETFDATTGPEGEVRWANAFITRGEKHYFLFNERGDLVIGDLSPDGFKELSRAHLLDPTNKDPGRPVVWSQPAFANRSVYARNDREIVCASLAASQ